MVFLIIRPFLLNFAQLFLRNQGLWGHLWRQNCSATKKFSAACLAKVTDIPHFTPICRRPSPALTPILCHVVPLMCRISYHFAIIMNIFSVRANLVFAQKDVGRALPAISFNHQFTPRWCRFCAASQPPGPRRAVRIRIPLA